MYFCGECRGQMLWETKTVWKDGTILNHDHATHKIEDYPWAKSCFFLKFNFINNQCGPNVFPNSLFLYIVCPMTPLYVEDTHNHQHGYHLNNKIMGFQDCICRYWYSNFPLDLDCSFENILGITLQNANTYGTNLRTWTLSMIKVLALMSYV